MKTKIGYYILLVGFLLTLPALAMAEGEQNEEEFEGIRHLVEKEETLGLVAIRYNVSIHDLIAWNQLDCHRVKPGDEILVKNGDAEPAAPSGPVPVVHRVRSGDTFEGIARRYGVRTSQVRNWNRNINPRRMQIGQEIVLHIPGSDGRSISWGRANQGRLFNGVEMPSGPGLRVRNPARSYGTQRVVDLLGAVGADVAHRWPDAPELVVGSLSVRNGGALRPHRSHQNGRDVDLNYFHRGNVDLPDFRDMTPETFDAVKNWHFLKTLIDTGEVQFIFVEYELQEVLYNYALSIGYTEEELSPILQYPRGPRVPEGLIRHARGHRNHVHIRFTCGPIDQNCR